MWRRITPRPPSGVALPGQPERLEILASLGAGPHGSAAEVRRELGSATVMAWIQDAGGGTYQVPAAGLLAADGRPHPLVVTLSGSRQASYPLRLLGLTVTYVLPPYDPADPQSSPTADLSVGSLAVAGTAGGPFGQSFSPRCRPGGVAGRGVGDRRAGRATEPGRAAAAIGRGAASDPGLAWRRERAAVHVQCRTRSVAAGPA